MFLCNIEQVAEGHLGKEATQVTPCSRPFSSFINDALLRWAFPRGVTLSSTPSARSGIKRKQLHTCLFLLIKLFLFLLLPSICSIWGGNCFSFVFVGFFFRKGARWQRWHSLAQLACCQNLSISPATRVTLLDLSPTNLSADALCGRKTSGHSLFGARSHCQNAHWRFKNGGRERGRGKERR